MLIPILGWALTSSVSVYGILKKHQLFTSALPYLKPIAAFAQRYNKYIASGLVFYDLVVEDSFAGAVGKAIGPEYKTVVEPIVKELTPVVTRAAIVGTRKVYKKVEDTLKTREQEKAKLKAPSTPEQPERKAGYIWVPAHTRNGHPVQGYWRKARS